MTLSESSLHCPERFSEQATSEQTVQRAVNVIYQSLQDLRGDRSAVCKLGINPTTTHQTRRSCDRCTGY